MKISSGALIALLVTVPPYAAAQGAAPADPSDPAARVPSLRFESTLAGYRRFEEPETVPWRSANDAVRRLGGHKGYIESAEESGARVGKEAPGAPTDGRATDAGHGIHHGERAGRQR